VVSSIAFAVQSRAVVPQAASPTPASSWTATPTQPTPTPSRPTPTPSPTQSSPKPPLQRGPDYAWARAIGGSESDGFRQVAIAPDGTIVAVGFAGSSDGDFAENGAGDFVAMFAADGTLMWNRPPAEGIYWLTDVAVDQDGRIIVVGFERIDDGRKAVIICLAPDGSLVWKTSLAASDPLDDSWAEFDGVAVDQDGSIVVVGMADGIRPDGDYGDIGPLDEDNGTCVLARFTSYGEQEWLTGVSHGTMQFWGIAIAPNGSILLGGMSSTVKNDKGRYPPPIGAGFTQDGELMWTRLIDGEDARLINVAVTPEGGMVAAKTLLSHLSRPRNPAGVASFTPDGDVAWFKPMTDWHDSPLAVDGFFDVAVTPAGQIVVVGDMEFPPNEQGYTAVITSLTPDAGINWTNTFRVGENGQFRGVAVTPDGGIVAVGSTCSSDGDLPALKGACDAVIVSINP